MKRLLFATLILCTGFSVSAQLPKGDRVLAYQVDMAENMDYNADFSIAQDACMESIHLFFTWPSLEPTSNSYDTAFISNFLNLVNLYYPANGVKAELQIAPINTNVLEVPSDMTGLAMNSQAMIDQFKQALDTVFAYIPNLELEALNIGNESDVYLGTDANAYAEFEIFLDSVIPYAKQLYFNIHGTDLKVGTTLTHHGLTDPATQALCQTLNADRDIISTTYYPLTPGFHMEPVSVVSSDFTDLVNIYSDTTQPIYFVECGYSSSATCSSSDAQQADFYTEVFSAWDQHYDNIKYLTIFKTTDWSAADVAIFEAYYGISDPAFLEYLRTLGIRTWPGSGTDKPALDRIKCELNARNWCSTSCTAALSEENTFNVTLYPNPVRESLSIDCEHEIINTAIISVDGKEVKSWKSNSTFLDVQELKSGIYMLRLQTEKGFSQIRFEKL